MPGNNPEPASQDTSLVTCRPHTNAVIIAVVVTALVSVGAVFGYMKWVARPPAPQAATVPVESISADKAKITELEKTVSDNRVQINQLIASNRLKDWGATQVFTDPSDTNSLYFVTEEVTHAGVAGVTLWKFDITKGANSTRGFFDVPGAQAFLYRQDVDKNHTVRVLGVDGSKFVFYVDDIDNSPGPCFSGWLNQPNLSSIDIGPTVSMVNLQKKAYTPSETVKSRETRAQNECLGDIENDRATADRERD